MMIKGVLRGQLYCTALMLSRGPEFVGDSNNPPIVTQSGNNHEHDRHQQQEEKLLSASRKFCNTIRPSADLQSRSCMIPMKIQMLTDMS